MKHVGKPLRGQANGIILANRNQYPETSQLEPHKNVEAWIRLMDNHDPDGHSNTHFRFDKLTSQLEYNRATCLDVAAGPIEIRSQGRLRCLTRAAVLGWTTDLEAPRGSRCAVREPATANPCMSPDSTPTNCALAPGRCCATCETADQSRVPGTGPATPSSVRTRTATARPTACRSWPRSGA
jgi:hypothetical protein